LKAKFLENFSTFYHGICENLAVIRKLTIKKKIYFETQIFVFTGNGACKRIYRKDNKRMKV
jgi:hypothetical protein